MKQPLVVVTLSLISSGVFADNTNKDNQDLEMILVSGQRATTERSEVASRLGLTLQETPAMVDVITQEHFQAQGLRSAIEAMNSATGVAAGNLPGSIGSVSMRGFHRAVNYLYDGVRMPNSDAGMRNWDAWAFERIEVIKGPASVTAGEGALAGAINFVPRRPKLDGISGEMLASYGSFDTARLAGDVNLPLGETVALRANASWTDSAGWIDDTDSRSIAASTALLLRPNDRFSAILSVDYFEDDFSTAYFGTPIVSPSVAREPSSVVSGSAGLVLDKAMDRINFDVLDSDLGSDSTWLRARAEYELSDTLRIVSDTSYYDSFRNWLNADEYTYNNTSRLIDRNTTIITHDHQFWNQRLHIVYDGEVAGLRSRISAGFEIGRTDFFTERRFGVASSVDPFNPQRDTFPAADTPSHFSTRQDVTADIEQGILFAEAAVNLTDKWLVVAGLRYDDITLDRRVDNVTSGERQRYGTTYDPLSLRAGMVYSITPQTQLFAQYTEAVTPVSGLLFMSASNATFDITTGESYEGGIKTAFAEDRVQLTASVFHIQQEDIVTRDPANPNIAYQGGEQASKGGELAVTWRLSHELSLALSGTLLDAEFKQLIDAGGVDRSGNRAANVPDRLVNLNLTYTPGTLPITLSAGVRYNGGFYTSNTNTVKVNSFTTYDAAIAWNADFGTLSLRGRNLSDELYADWSGYASGLVFLGAPRSVDLTFRKSF